MLKGVGLDLVDISETARLIKELGSTYLAGTYTKAELRAAETAPLPAEYLAGRFAVKEAVFKALAPLTGSAAFDLRIVETLDAEDGHPQVTLSGELLAAMKSVGVERLIVSISHESNMAAAVVIAAV